MKEALKQFLIKTKVLKPLPFEGYYINVSGQIYSSKAKKCLTPYSRGGYYRVRLRVDNKQMDVGVHRLLGMAYLNGYFEGAVINHINGIKHDNRLSNLEWTTQKRNAQLAVNKPLIVTTKSGVELYYSNCNELRDHLLGGHSGGNLQKHIRENSGKIKKYGLSVRYLN